MTRLSVALDHGVAPVAVGTLAWSKSDRAAGFQYEPSFLQSGLELSPLRLATRADLAMAPRVPFDGLHGLFADSLPDGWGRMLVDRRLSAIGRDPASLTPLDRLAIVGTRGMGALTFRPEAMIANQDGGGEVDLDWYRYQADAIQRESGGADIEALFRGAGGSAGARPKIVVLRNRKTGALRIDIGQPVDSEEDHWLVKFRSAADPSGSGRVEHAFAMMAQAAGIDFPQTMLLEGPSGRAYFATRRFDRSQGRRIHVHTLAGLVESDVRAPSLDYDDLLKVARIVTGSMADVAEAFRRMVFNVVAGNRDDHDKNHAFVMAQDGLWHLSPAYDVTPSAGPGGEHSLTVGGEGRRPGRKAMLKVAERASLRREAATEAIDQVEAAVANWSVFAAAAGLRAEAAQRVATDLQLSASSALGRPVRLG